MRKHLPPHWGPVSRLSALGILLGGLALPAAGASFVVKSGGDSLPAGATPCTSNAANCTLRDAIAEANQLTGPHTITFDPAVLQVTLVNGGGLAITSPITITGTLPTRTIVYGNGQACFSLSDANTGQNPDGANGSVIQNLVIQGCNGDAISANGHGLAFINNYIGTDATGMTGVANSGHGISLSSSHVYVLDPTGLSDFYSGLPITPVDPADVSTFVNAFASNLTTAMTALSQPVLVTGNVISGNGQNGLEIYSENLAGVIATGNMIGVTADGSAALPNAHTGVRLTGSTFGNAIGPGNIISGNGEYGIRVDAGAVVMPNFIMGNLIGIGATVGSQVGNGKSGIYVADSKPQTDPSKPNPSGMSLMIGPGNVISDNQGASPSPDPDAQLGGAEAGIVITGGANTSGVKVIGNTIGIAQFPAGTPLQSSSYGNAGDGIRISANGNTIGGGSAAEANIIAANGRHGITVHTAASGNNILGNHIGVHPSFATDYTLGNVVDGIHIDNGNNTTIGGASSGEANHIAGNGRNGVRIMNGNTSAGWGNMLQRNLVFKNARAMIGVGIDLDHTLNAADGIHSEFSSNYANLDQVMPQLCAGNEGSGPCNGSSLPSTGSGTTTLDWSLATHGPATFRVDFYALNNADGNVATTMTHLGDTLVSTALNGALSSGQANTTCAGAGAGTPGICSTTLPTSASGMYVVATATDITLITDTPSNSGDWKGSLTCFVGNLGVVLSSCPVNNTSEFSTAQYVLPSAPAAVTGPADPIGQTTATLTGTVTSNGNTTSVQFEYGPDTNYGVASATPQSPLAPDVINGAVSLNVSGLVCGNTYHYRVKAQSGMGISYGNDATFSTAACVASAPVASTGSATSILATSATLNGTVSANGAATTVSFEYGLTTAYGSTITPPQSPVSAGGSNVAVSATPGGLSCGKTYHFRVTANNGVGGIVTGSDATFTTAACSATAPAAATGSASAIAASSATLNATVTANGASTTVYFEYGTTVAYGSTITSPQSPVSAGGSNVTVSATPGGLSCNTLYHFRVAANNGVGGTILGSDGTFTTAACGASAPTVSTGSATGIAPTSATLNGTVTANGASTTVSFEYGTTLAYGGTITPPQSPVAAGGNNVAVAATPGNLSCGTTYHFRVSASNGVGGTITGNDATFTTAACAANAPTATTGSASGIAATSATLNGTVTANGAATAVVFEYGTTMAYGSTMTSPQSPVAAGGSNIAVSAAPGGLSCNTLYHFRVTANNGVGGTVNGSDATFTTAACGGAQTATTTAITSPTAGGSSTSLQSITVTATVTPSAPNPATPSGTIQVSDGSVSCQITLPGNSCTLPQGGAGSKTLTASYSGDANFLSSVSAGVSHTVQAVSTFSGTTATGTSASVTLVNGAGCTFTQAQFVPVSSVPTAPPAGMQFPHGLFDFVLKGCTPGASATLQLTYSAPVDNATYAKYGPTPPNQPAAWYIMPGTVAAGNQLSLTITDGQIGDDDLQADGTIIDQGGPVVAAAPGGIEQVPLLSPAALVSLLSVVLMLGGFSLRQGRSRH